VIQPKARIPPLPCPQCGAPLAVSASRRSGGGRLFWMHCRACETHHTGHYTTTATLTPPMQGAPCAYLDTLTHAQASAIVHYIVTGGHCTCPPRPGASRAREMP
jgi:hypothetical protein